MTDYQKYINALRKCAKEHENDRTFTGNIIVSDLCRDTANLLEELSSSENPNFSENPISSTTKNCESCRHYGLHHELCNYCYKCSLWTEKEPTTKNDLGVDCISRQAVIDELKRYFHDEYYQRTSIQDCRDCFIEDVLNNLPSVTPQDPCDKCEVTFKDDNAVSRLSVRDIIYANAYELEYPDGSSEYVVNRDELFKYLMELPSVTPQLSSELEKNSKKLEKNFGELDCISRADALRVAKNEYLRGWHNALCKALREKYSIHCEEGNFSVIQEETITGLGLSMNCAAGKDVESYISTIPRVTPIRPKGHWFVDERPESDREVICSNCEQPVFKYHKLDFDYRPKFCPNCGADMSEVKDGKFKD